MIWTGTDRRRFKRLNNMNLPLKFQIGKPDRTTFWVLRDISIDGVRVEFLILKNPPVFEVDDKIPFSLSITNPDYNIQCTTQIKRKYYETRGNNEVCGLGLQFEDMNENAKDYLNRFIEERLN